jgi:predicted nuclease of predicted toxin-antitoxin system
MDDSDIVRKAFDENWILITNDKDFGEQVYRERKPHHGIVLLRLEDERAKSKIELLKRLLNSHVDRLPEQFVVVTEKA